VADDASPVSLPSLDDTLDNAMVSSDLAGGRGSCMSAMSTLSSMRFYGAGEGEEQGEVRTSWRARGDSEDVLHMLGRLAQNIPEVGQQLQDQEAEIDALRVELQNHIDRAAQAEEMKEALADRETELLELRARVSRPSGRTVSSKNTVWSSPQRAVVRFPGPKASLVTKLRQAWSRQLRINEVILRV